eukprot:7810098-Pyramimonas_sp.AAC.1
MDVFRLIAAVAACGRALDKNEERELSRIRCVGSDCLKQGLLDRAWHDPCCFAMRSLTSDGTPLTVSDSIKEHLGPTVFRRYGKSCHEFLVGCQYYKVTDPTGAE